VRLNGKLNVFDTRNICLYDAKKCDLKKKFSKEWATAKMPF